MIDKILRRLVFERDAGICAKCQADCEKIKRVYWAILDSPAQWFYADLIGFQESRTLWEIDHIQERANGGSDSLSNLQTLCRKCHNGKSAAFLMKGDKKRVPLNCLVLPQTMAILKAAKESNGVAVDQAIAIWVQFQSTLAENIGKHFQPEPLSDSPNVVKAIRKGLGLERPFKPPLLRPREQKK